MQWLKRRRGPEHWFLLHAASVADMDAGRISGSEAFDRRAKAQWGLIACGTEAVPYALRMLASPDADVREDAGGVLGAIGRQPEVVDAVLDALETENDQQTRDSLVLALGQLGDHRAVPRLAALIRSNATDEDTRFTAVQSLGRLARQHFDRRDEPVAAALEWLDKRGH